MKRETFQIEIITPCFCAGADQSKAEIRPASIRGQLRWWFRLLSREHREEAKIFGAVDGDDECSSASLCVRVSDFKPGPKWEVPALNQNSPENYVWHYASVSGTSGRGAKGPRWASQAVLSPGSTFRLELIWRRALSSALKAKFDLALKAFLALGTLGLRSTRGLGSIHCKTAVYDDSLKAALTELGFVIRERERTEGFPSYQSALKDYASWLRYDFRKRLKADMPSPLGSSTPRQTSAVRFRPLKHPAGNFSWLAYEAPHSRVLNRESRTVEPLLNNVRFVGVAPAAPLSRRRF